MYMKKSKVLSMVLATSIFMTGCGMSSTIDLSSSKKITISSEIRLSEEDAKKLEITESDFDEYAATLDTLGDEYEGYECKKVKNGKKTEYIVSCSEKMDYGELEMNDYLDRKHICISKDDSEELMGALMGSLDMVGDSLEYGGLDQNDELYDDIETDLDDMSEVNGVYDDDEAVTEYLEMMDEMLNSMDYSFSVKFPKKVVITNGKVSKSDKCTVTFDVINSGSEVFYAYTSDYKDKQKPTVKGVKEGSTYKKAITITFKDNTVIKSATLDGKKIKSGKKVTTNGKHKLVVTDVFGNKTVVNFTIKK